MLPTWCGYKLPGIIMLHNLKGAMWLDCSKDISYIYAEFNLHQLRFQHINTSCVEVVVLIRHAFTSCGKNECLVFRAMNQHYILWEIGK